MIGLRCGRLANRTILFANLIALAEEQGHRVINYTFHSYADLFAGTQKNLHCAYPIPHRKSWLDFFPGMGALIRKTRIFYHFTRCACIVNERLPIFGKTVVTLRQSKEKFITPLDGPEVQEKIRAAKVVLVYDWRFRAPHLVEKHAAKIRDYFRPLIQLENISRAAVESLRSRADIVVGVHIRQGDYRNWKGGKFFYPVERYAAWMNELAAQFPNRKIGFFVCSDEPRNAGEFSGLTVAFGSGPAVIDLYALAKCDYIMGTKSTFSEWAAFYGGKPLLHLLDRNTTIKLENFRRCFLDWD